jgi:hypothetical protein
MNIMEKIIREEARLVMMRELAAYPDRRLHSDLLRQALELFGITKSREWVHEELRGLQDIGAVQINDIGTIRVATLTAKGLDHVERRIVLDGVKRPSPEA